MDAQDAARSAVRALVTADGWGEGVAAAQVAVAAIASGDNLPPQDVQLSLSGSLSPGATVIASVTVIVPATSIPFLGYFGAVHYTATSVAHVDSYRDGNS